MIRVVPFDGDRRRWDALIADERGATFAHLAGWRTLMHDVLGHETLYQVAVDDAGAWVGALPLVRVRTPLIGQFLLSMPFLNSGGPVGRDDAVAALAEWAAEEARRSGAALLELRNREAIPAALRVSDRKITVRLPLPATAAELWSAFPAKLRSQVRRPQREGFEVRFGHAERESFYDVYSRTMHTLGTPALPGRLFREIAETFGDIAHFGAVYRGAEPVAAGCGFAFHGEFELHWAGALRAWQRAAPNMLMYWAFMERMIERGIGVFDFGRCTPGGGTHAFKRQWGGADTPLPWAQWSSRELTAPPSPDRPMFRFAAACWRRLPYAVTNRVGPVIASRLP